MRKINVLSLFCGAGGLDLGFVKAGFDVKLAIDFSKAAVKTHKANFTNSVAQQHDLLDIGVDGVLKLCSENFNIDEPIGIIGGPPCQGFSRSNMQSNENDPRNQLALLYIDIIEALSKSYEVKFVIFENVVGIKDKKHNKIYSSIISKLNDLNFHVFEKTLNAIDFGVAQDRKRVIIISINKKFMRKEPNFSKNEKYLTVKDVISDLPEPIFFRRGLDKTMIPFHPNHWTMQPKSKKFLNPDLFNNKNRSFRVVSWDKPSPTVAYGNREIHVHPNRKRRLSIFESLLLQGFPKDFVLEGTLSQQVTQVSNAVPPPMAQKIAEIMMQVVI